MKALGLNKQPCRGAQVYLRLACSSALQAKNVQQYTHRDQSPAKVETGKTKNTMTISLEIFKAFTPSPTALGT